MIKRLKSKSEFSKNVITLMTGTTVAQAIPIAITPILTRMYTPEDFGVLALFVAITSIFGAIANGRYELAIMLPDEDDDAINIAALGLLIVSVLSIILFLPAVFLNEYITDALDNQFIGFWLYFVPIVVWLLGLYNILNYLNNRKKSYKDMAKATVYKSIVQAVVQLGMGSIKAAASGLITGQIVSTLVANTRLAFNAKRQYQLSSVRYVEIKRMAKRYIDFPKYTLWASLANTLSQNSNNILISSFYGLSTLGFYSFTERILGVPSTIIGKSIGQVYFQEASREFQNTGTVFKSFISTSKKLAIIGIPFFILIYLFVEDIFYYVFGSEWVVAGTYAKIMVPFFLIRFIVSPLTLTNQIKRKNKLGMFWQFGLLFLYLVTIYSTHLMNYDFISFLQLLVKALSIYYMFFYILIFSHARKKGDGCE
jgi:O-antigen/teichoic acid export membrane protein